MPLKTIYKMTRDDKRMLANHIGHTSCHASYEDHYALAQRFPTLHLTRYTFTPKKDGMVDPKGRVEVRYDVDECGLFDCLSDAVFVLKTTGRLNLAPPKD